MRLGVQAFFKCRSDARLADARLARDQYDLAVARRGARPPSQQQADLFVTANQPGHLRSAQCLEAARHDTLTQHLPTPYWLGVAVRVQCAEFAAIEQVADQTPGGRLDCHGVGLHRYLQPRRQVRGLADNPVVPDLAAPDEIANDDHSRRYADPAPHRHVGIGSQGPDRRTQFEPRADRLLGVVFVRRGIAEKDENGIPETAGDKPAVATNDLRDAVLKGADRFGQILETAPVGSRRHADRFARHGSDLPTFGFIMLRDPHPVGSFWLYLPCDLEAKARLADLSLTDRRNRAIGRHDIRYLGDRGLSADQFGYALDEVGRRAGRGGSGEGRRNLSRADVCLELADLAGELVASPGNRLEI